MKPCIRWHWITLKPPIGLKNKHMHSEQAEKFLERSAEMAPDLDHRKKINFNIGKYNAVVPQGKAQFEHLELARKKAKKAAEPAPAAEPAAPKNPVLAEPGDEDDDAALNAAVDAVEDTVDDIAD